MHLGNIPCGIRKLKRNGEEIYMSAPGSTSNNTHAQPNILASEDSALYMADAILAVSRGILLCGNAGL